MSDRGAIQLVDIVLGLLTLVAIIAAFAPLLERFITMVSAEVDPFSQLLLVLFLPFVLLAFLVSMGVSARGGQ